MCKACGCTATGKKIQYKCDCKQGNCECDSVIEFEKEPQAVPYCCGFPMRLVK